MTIGFTGTQSGLTNFQKSMIEVILKAEGCDHFIHGDCIGADSQACRIVVMNEIHRITIFPPDNPNKRAWEFNPKKDTNKKWEWEEQIIWNETVNPRQEIKIQVRWAPRAPYLERNKHIVDNCEMMIACPKEPEHTVRSGTWSTIRYAWKTHRKITIVPPIVRDE